MVITGSKPLKEILDQLKNYNNLIILGCSECAAMCKTGGEDEVLELKETLTKEDKNVLAVKVLTTSCNDLLTKRELKDLKDEIERADAVISMACGNGAQTVAKLTKKPVIIANNTLFVGEKLPGGRFVENCRTCGACVLGRTAGICPVSRCSKGLLNGGCGGSTDGKCEVNPDIDCAWVEIFNTLKEQGRLDLYEQVQPIRSYINLNKPRSLSKKKK